MRGSVLTVLRVGNGWRGWQGARQESWQGIDYGENIALTTWKFSIAACANPGRRADRAAADAGGSGFWGQAMNNPTDGTGRDPTDVTAVAPEPPSLRSSGTDDGPASEVTIRFDQRSVRRAAVTVLLLVGVFLLANWVYSQVSHFLFLILLAWLFAIALEPGIRALIRRGVSRGAGAAIMGGGAIVIGLVLVVVFGRVFFTQAAQFAASVPDLASPLSPGSTPTSVRRWTLRRCRPR